MDRGQKKVAGDAAGLPSGNQELLSFCYLGSGHKRFCCNEEWDLRV
jgi:hypothetical protein